MLQNIQILRTYGRKMQLNNAESGHVETTLAVSRVYPWERNLKCRDFIVVKIAQTPERTSWTGERTSQTPERTLQNTDEKPFSRKLSPSWFTHSNVALLTNHLLMTFEKTCHLLFLQGKDTCCTVPAKWNCDIWALQLFSPTPALQYLRPHLLLASNYTINV